jgi:hypothetical protein
MAPLSKLQNIKPTVAASWQQVAGMLQPETDSGSQSCLLTQPPCKTTTVLLIKYQHQDWMLKEKHQNY